MAPTYFLRCVRASYLRCFVDANCQVQSDLFDVPRRWFEDSPAFRAMFELPVDENEVPDGSGQDHPFRLEGIDKTDFNALLECMAQKLPVLEYQWQKYYSFQLVPTIGERLPSIPKWLSVLKLSNMWGFNKIQSQAVGQIFHNRLPIRPIDQVMVVKQLGIHYMLPQSLRTYMFQPSLKAEDANIMGLDYFLKILDIGERMTYRNSKCTHCNDPLGFGVHTKFEYPGIEIRADHDFSDALRSTFGEEVEPDTDQETVAHRRNLPSRITNTTSKGFELDESFFLADIIFLVSLICLVLMGDTISFLI
jgi:hypothetical protein